MFIKLNAKEPDSIRVNINQIVSYWSYNGKTYLLTCADDVERPNSIKETPEEIDMLIKQAMEK